LVVDDEPDTRALLWDVLVDEEYEVHLCSSGQQALDALKQFKFTLVLADIKMPGMSGMELLVEIRGMAPDVKVILMTAHASVETAIQALRGQAFDYLIKPFDLDQFRRRVYLALHTDARPDVMRFGDLTIDRQGRRVWMGEHEIRLTRLEYNVLDYLCQHPGHVVSYEKLLREVWDRDRQDERSVDTVKSLISRLRRRLGDDADEPCYVANVWGVGYKFMG
jgi:DNA-binding response OmpR family regulator